jgi:GAF domain-containing protein
LEHELAHHQQESDRLQRQLLDIEAESKRFSERYFEVEQQSANLANLYVASYRLHGTLNREEVLAVIQEIIINLIGSEELGIFELDANDGELTLVSQFGLDASRFERIPVGLGVIGNAAITGETYITGNMNGHRRLPQESNLSACIPLKIDSRVTGAIALFRLLQHKNGFDSVDHELFDLLATHAATALYCTGHAHPAR